MARRCDEIKLVLGWVLEVEATNDDGVEQSDAVGRITARARSVFTRTAMEPVNCRSGSASYTIGRYGSRWKCKNLLLPDCSRQNGEMIWFWHHLENSQKGLRIRTVLAELYTARVWLLATVTVLHSLMMRCLTRCTVESLTVACTVHEKFHRDIVVIISISLL